VSCFSILVKWLTEKPRISFRKNKIGNNLKKFMSLGIAKTIVTPTVTKKAEISL